MKTKFGAIIVDGRGKIGGHVASKNRAGSYLRTKVTPVNAQTSYQSGARNRFTGLSQGWRGLTPALIAAWNAAVSDFTKTDVFGDLKTPTGFNLHQRLNNNLIDIGVAPITTPPLPAAVGSVVSTALVVAITIPSVTLTLAAAVPAGTYVKVWATAPMSAGKSYVKSLYREISVLAPAAAASQVLTTDYVAKFGSVGVVGQKIYVKTVAVNGTTGQTGTASEVSGISSAS